MYAILNAERNRMLTSATGKGVWDNKEEAERVMNGEFMGGSHLEIVEVNRLSD